MVGAFFRPLFKVLSSSSDLHRFPARPPARLYSEISMGEPATREQPFQPSLAISRAEFIGLAAALMALNAMAIDIMLPALQQIGGALNVADENSRQFIIT